MAQMLTIDDTFAEAFPMSATRIIITALDVELVSAAAASPGMVRITAGNCGGKPGPHHFHLHRLQDMIT